MLSRQRSRIGSGVGGRRTSLAGGVEDLFATLLLVALGGCTSSADWDASADASTVDTIAPGAGTNATGLDAVAEARSEAGSDAASDGTVDVATEATVDAALDADAFTAMQDVPDITDAADSTDAAVEASVPVCYASPTGVCSPTELLLIAHGADCYNCLVESSCLDDSGSPPDTNQECEDLIGDADAGLGAGESNEMLCLDTLACILSTNCAANVASDGAADPANVAQCYCGTVGPSTCFSGDVPPNGACVTQEVLGLDTTSPMAIGAQFLSPSLPSGMANHIFGCALTNGCTSCLVPPLADAGDINPPNLGGACGGPNEPCCALWPFCTPNAGIGCGSDNTCVPCGHVNEPVCFNGTGCSTTDLAPGCTDSSNCQCTLACSGPGCNTGCDGASCTCVFGAGC